MGGGERGPTSLAFIKGSQQELGYRGLTKVRREEGGGKSREYRKGRQRGAGREAKGGEYKRRGRGERRKGKQIGAGREAKDGERNTRGEEEARRREEEKEGHTHPKDWMTPFANCINRQVHVYGVTEIKKLQRVVQIRQQTKICFTFRRSVDGPEKKIKEGA
jgi:hypothetical protein